MARSKSSRVRERLVIDDRRRDPRIAREGEAARVGPVRQDERDPRRKSRLARRRDQRAHVGAATGDEDGGALGGHRSSFSE
jgi:hypothetical protein